MCFMFLETLEGVFLGRMIRSGVSEGVVFLETLDPLFLLCVIRSGVSHGILYF